MSTHYVPGQWNVLCYICGRQFKSGSLRQHWTGTWRCPQDWEIRHPQDLIRPVTDNQVPEWTQVRSPSHFIEFCTPNNQTAVPGFAWPGCAIPGFIHSAFDPIFF